MTYLPFLTHMAIFLIFFKQDIKFLPFFCRPNPKIEKLKKLRSKRDNEKAAACLTALKEKALSTENLMPAVLEAVENYCTLGEIYDELRKIFGDRK